MSNVRRTLAIKIQTPGGDNPLQMQLVGDGPFFRGIPVTGLALVGKGGTAPYAFSIISGGDSNGGVNGLTLNPDGTFSGAGDASGRFMFVAEIADSASNVFIHSFSLTFLPQLIVVRGTPPPGENLLHYNFQFIVRDLTGTTITSGYSVTEGSVPSGLTLHTNGLYDGDPAFAAVGTTYFTVTVTNGSDSIDIRVAHVIYGPLLSFGLEEKTYFYVGIPQSARGNSTFGPTGGLQPYRYRWDNLADYPWLKYDYPTNTFSGVPAFENIGVEQTITGVVTDALGAVIDPFIFKFTPIFAQGGIDIGGGQKIFPPADTGYLVLGSDDDSVEITQDTSGGINLRASGGGGSGVQTINGVGPGTHGDLPIDGIGIDSNGDLFVIPSGATSPLTAKGDLWGYGTVNMRVPVGTNDLPLVGDSSATAGVSYKILPVAGGGTSFGSYTQGDILYASASGVLSKLAKSASATRYMANTGTSNNPAWAQVDLTNGVTGALPIPNGGTGQITATLAFNALAPASPAKGDILVFNGTDWVKHTHGTNGQLIQFDSSQSDGLVNITSPAVPFLSLSGAIMALTPMAFWKMSETTGTTFVDSSGNGYDLTHNITSLAQMYMIPTITNEKFPYFGTISSQLAQRSGLLGFTAPMTGSWTMHLVLFYGAPGATIIPITMGGIGSGGTANNNVQAQITIQTGASNQIQWQNGVNATVATSLPSGITGFYTARSGVPQQIVVVKDATAGSIAWYTNGKLNLRQIAYSAQPTGGSASSVGIGNGITGHTSACDSVIGYAAIWGSALTDAQIRDLAIAGGLY